MVKLYYINRKSEGIKLGQVVAKDLLKRLPPGSNHKSAVRDPCVDLDVSGKALTDEGCKEIANALATALTYHDQHGRVVQLEELCLKGNELTALSLKPLAKVIALASRDLRDLDISENLFRITSREDAAAWEEFLEAFSECCVLRRIDFSGNALGPKAFEVLARVYSRERTTFVENNMLAIASQPRITASTASSGVSPNSYGMAKRKKSLVSKNAATGVEPQTPTDSSGNGDSQLETDIITNTQTPAGSAADQQGELPFCRTQGLHFVPYLIFVDTAMNDTSALYLSYVIAFHDMPLNLLKHVPPVKAGLPSQQLESYDQTLSCRGIIYRPNDSIRSAGSKVLELAELVREGSIKGMTEELISNKVKILVTPTTLVTPAGAGRRASEARSQQSPQQADNRRRSAVSMSSEDTSHSSGSSYTIELHRARSRIQGDSLRDSGPRSNDLWRVALKMLSVARAVLVDTKQSRSQRTLALAKAGEMSFVQSADMLATKAPTHRLGVPTPLASANANYSMVLKLPHRKKEAVVPPPLAVNMTPAARIVAEKNPEPPIAPENAGKGSSYRTLLPGGLDEQTWGWIISIACQGQKVVSPEQELAILRWARDRNSLRREMEALGKAESAQIWKVLEGMGCLAYYSSA